jgi:hypothetical protein
MSDDLFAQGKNGSLIERVTEIENFGESVSHPLAESLQAFASDKKFDRVPLTKNNWLGDIDNTADRIIAYPVPSADQFTVDVSNLDIESYQLELYSSKGTLVLSSGRVTSVNHTINVSELNSGVYFLKLVSKNVVASKKIQVLR